MNSQCVLNITFGWHLVEEKDYSELKTAMTMRKIVHNFLQDQSLTDKKNVHEESWLHTSWLVRPRVQGSLINITYEAVSINVLKLTTYGYTDLQKRCWFFFVFSIFFSESDWHIGLKIVLIHETDSWHAVLRSMPTACLSRNFFSDIQHSFHINILRNKPIRQR